jgi:predicted regulator of Ras-like GTPase activity (Roadblock/LC7/MglB family)
MPIQGNLKDMNLASLISFACNEMQPSRLWIANGEREAVVFFGAGTIVHATLDDREGEEVIYETLAWEDGEFELVTDIPSPRHTVCTDWQLLILEGMRRLDDRNGPGIDFEDAGPLMEENVAEADLVAELRTMDGVAGAVIVARDGIVLASDLEGNAEKQGAVAVFVGNAANQIGETLGLGSFDRGVIELGAAKDRMLVVQRPDYFVGLLLEERASPVLVLEQARNLLG